jgi:hypothetical protein
MVTTRLRHPSALPYIAAPKIVGGELGQGLLPQRRAVDPKFKGLANPDTR